MMTRTIMCENYSGGDRRWYKTMTPERRETCEVSCTVTQPFSSLVEDNVPIMFQRPGLPIEPGHATELRKLQSEFRVAKAAII